MSMIKMVSSGTVTGDVYYSGCSYVELKELCVIVNTYVQSTCKGQFEFQDENDNKALVVTPDVERKYVLWCITIRMSLIIFPVWGVILLCFFLETCSYSWGAKSVSGRDHPWCAERSLSLLWLLEVLLLWK